MANVAHFASYTMFVVIWCCLYYPALAEDVYLCCAEEACVARYGRYSSLFVVH